MKQTHTGNLLSPEYMEAVRTDALVSRMHRAGMSVEVILLALTKDRARMARELVSMSFETPCRITDSDGKEFIYRLPDEFVRSLDSPLKREGDSL